jgi:hypothetical protein
MPASICRQVGISPEDDLHPPLASLIARDGGNWAKFRQFCALGPGATGHSMRFRVAFQ